jgi:hypothetical protein
MPTLSWLREDRPGSWGPSAPSANSVEARPIHVGPRVRRLGRATIRIDELERFTGIDTDGDGLADRVIVDISRHRLSCPDVG